jgi:RimJ/RimL family protein N-acetyltransferase
MTWHRLHHEQYWKAAEKLESVELNTLFASAVLDRMIPGTVYVDAADEPSAYLVAHPYGMSLLFGDTRNIEFNESLRGYMLNAGHQREKLEWLQIHPASWKPQIEAILGQALVAKAGPPDRPATAQDDQSRVMEYTRVNFKFDTARYRAFAGQHAPFAGEVVRTEADLFRGIQGQVVPRYFWRDADDFMGRGVGFTVMVEGAPASTAFCAFLKDNKFELGIETARQHRGRGYAVHACKAIIDYCLENGYEPIWSCRLENTGSYNLAQRLGFVPVLYVPYYQLVR